MPWLRHPLKWDLFYLYYPNSLQSQAHNFSEGCIQVPTDDEQDGDYIDEESGDDNEDDEFDEREIFENEEIDDNFWSFGTLCCLFYYISGTILITSAFFMGLERNKNISIDYKSFH